MRRRRRRRRRTTVIKSNNPHLAGGEKTLFSNGQMLLKSQGSVCSAPFKTLSCSTSSRVRTFVSNEEKSTLTVSARKDKW